MTKKLATLVAMLVGGNARVLRIWCAGTKSGNHTRN